jgi:preflagellin peptidase FlaK
MNITIPLIATLIAIIACFIASYTDIRWGIIPNKLTFPLIGLGIALNVLIAFMIDSIWYLIASLVITLVVFGLGYLFWRLGAWAGGDVKLYTALAALIPFYFPLVSYQVLGVEMPIIATYPFPFTIIINSILSILPFLLIFVFYIVLKKKRHLLKEIISPVMDWKKNIVLTLVITSAVTITFFITQQIQFQLILLSLILIYLLSLIISKLPNQVKTVLVSLITVFALFNNFWVTFFGLIILFVSIILLEIIKKILTSVSKEALQDDVLIKNLQEGMIPAYNMYEKGDEVYVDDKGLFSKISSAFRSRDMSQLTNTPGKLLISSMAAGLSEENINLLVKLEKEKKIEETLRIKIGVPFAPSIFIGLLISLFIGDLALIIEKTLTSILY